MSKIFHYTITEHSDTDNYLVVSESQSGANKKLLEMLVEEFGEIQGHLRFGLFIKEPVVEHTAGVCITQRFD